ncbi:hypothetical protein ACTWQL_17850 [Pseudalkalibacillus sp. R45]|uniref:hypothetical protein n=1 Tax=Pseudalkalibacillus sp. R45 TaxID=3457433 RepID=UPI003FCDF5B5
MQNVTKKWKSSDRDWQKSLIPVRRRGDFGQRMAETACPCPKKRGLRTEIGRIRLSLSEEEGTSDRDWQKPLVPVRRRGNFGQRLAETACPCPN